MSVVGLSVPPIPIKCVSVDRRSGRAEAGVVLAVFVADDGGPDGIVAFGGRLARLSDLEADPARITHTSLGRTPSNLEPTVSEVVDDLRRRIGVV